MHSNSNGIFRSEKKPFFFFFGGAHELISGWVAHLLPPLEHLRQQNLVASMV